MDGFEKIRIVVRESCKSNGGGFEFYSLKCLFVCAILYFVLTLVHIIFSLSRFEVGKLYAKGKLFSVARKVVIEELNCARPAFMALCIATFLAFVYVDMYRFFRFSDFYVIPAFLLILGLSAFYAYLGIRHDEKFRMRRIVDDSKIRTSINFHCA